MQWTKLHERCCDIAAGVALAAFLGTATALAGVITICGDIDVFVAMLDGGVASVAFLCVWLFVPPLFYDFQHKAKPLQSGAVLLRCGIVLIWFVIGLWSLLRITIGNFTYGVPSRAIQLLITIIAGLLHDSAVARFEGGSVYQHAKLASIVGLAGMFIAGLVIHYLRDFYDLACNLPQSWMDL